MKRSHAIKATHDRERQGAPLWQTYERARAVMADLGLTDIRDMTDYDAVSIPVWGVWQQNNQADQIIAYGKGVSDIQAQVSAMMEAIEQYSAEQLPRTVKRASYHELRQSVDVLELQKVTHGAPTAHLENVALDWVRGVDLIAKKEVWVPVDAIVLHPIRSGPQCVPIRTSNGLASGNTFEEAVCNALCELIERDAWTLAWLRAVTIPHMRAMARRILQHQGSVVWSDPDFIPEANLLPELDSASLPDTARQLIAQFERAGVEPIVRDMTTDIGIPAFLAASKETIHDEKLAIYYGASAHPSAQVAIIRAITECAQARLAAVQGSDATQRRGQAVSPAFLRQLFFAPCETKRDFSSIITYSREDTFNDVHAMLSQLSKVGVDQVVAVDLTIPEIGVPVVRVLVPDIEDWSAFHFSPEHCYLGHRGRRCVEIIR